MNAYLVNSTSYKTKESLDAGSTAADCRLLVQWLDSHSVSVSWAMDRQPLIVGYWAIARQPRSAGFLGNESIVAECWCIEQWFEIS